MADLWYIVWLAEWEAARLGGKAWAEYVATSERLLGLQWRQIREQLAVMGSVASEARGVALSEMDEWGDA